MNKFIKNKSLLITLLYIMGLVGMLSILVAVEAGKKSPAGGTAVHTYEDTGALWTLDREGTQPADLKKLGEYMDPDTGELSIYHQLPELNGDISLVFRSKDVRTRVFIDGELIYEPSVYESGLYNRSPGNLWNYVRLQELYSERCLEIQIHAVYNTRAVTVDSLYIGDKADVIVSLINKNLWGIIFSVLLILGGIVLMLLDILPTYGRVRRNHSTFWLGIFALLLGIWSLLETNVVQFCVRDMRILQLIDNMIMMCGGIMPMMLYMDREYKILQNRLMRLIAYADVFFILASVLMQISGFADFHYVVDYAVYAMVLYDVVLLVWFLHIVRKLKKEEKPLLNSILRLSGISALIFLCFCEVAKRYIYADSLDRAGMIRIGMVILTICFTISNQLETYKLLEQGTKYDIVSRLAYSDGLTGLGNRTSYLEQLEEYGNSENSRVKLGIVYLDVNNLKKVNDNQGHEMGDTLIKLAADIIEGSFGQYGKSYRIGGDEFCVLMTGHDLGDKYEKGLKDFLTLVDKTNTAKKYPFYLQIAHGFAACEVYNQQAIDDAVNLADIEMYKNKAMLKKALAGSCSV